jgi:hypothetical protein
MTIKHSVSSLYPAAVTLAALVIMATAVSAFSPPTQSPPSGNVVAPVTAAGDQTITGLKTFNPLSLFPFVIDASNANTVANLDADKLDAFDAADLLAGGGGGSGGGGSTVLWGVSNNPRPSPGAGTAACPSGWNEVYAGYAWVPRYAPGETGAQGVGVMHCNTQLSGWSAGASNFAQFITGGHGNLQTHGFWDGFNSTTITCRVCAADITAGGIAGAETYSQKCNWASLSIYNGSTGAHIPVITCTPSSCASGDASLGTGCATTSYDVGSGGVGTPLQTGYCERICQVQ